MPGPFRSGPRFPHKKSQLQPFVIGGTEFARGLLSFYAACTIGAIINVEIAGLLYGQAVPWALAGILGAVVGSVWNYGVTSTFTWGTRRRREPGTALEGAKAATSEAAATASQPGPPQHARGA